MDTIGSTASDGLHVGGGDPVEAPFLIGRELSIAAHLRIRVAILSIGALTDDAVVAGIPEVRMPEAKIVAEFVDRDAG